MHTGTDTRMGTCTHAQMHKWTEAHMQRRSHFLEGGNGTALSFNVLADSKKVLYSFTNHSAMTTYLTVKFGHLINNIILHNNTCEIQRNLHCRRLILRSNKKLLNIRDRRKPFSFYSEVN